MMGKFPDFFSKKDEFSKKQKSSSSRIRAKLFPTGIILKVVKSFKKKEKKMMIKKKYLLSVVVLFFLIGLCPGTVSAGNNAGEPLEEVSQQSSTLCENHLYHEFWIGNEGWRRYIPFPDGISTIPFDSGSYWELQPIPISTMPGSGDMQAINAYRLGNTLHQGIWRGNQGFTRTIPLHSVTALPIWSSASNWSNPIPISLMPGSGDMQALNSYRLVNTMYQGLWRGDQGWTRTIPIIAEVVRWDLASTWSGDRKSVV